MCVSWKNILIRIINELQAEKFGVAEQTGIILGTNTSHPLPESTLHEKPNYKEVWRKPIAFVIHKVAMTLKEGTATLDPQSSLESRHSLWSTAPLAGAHQSRTFHKEPNLLPCFWQNEIAREKEFILKMLSPSASQLPAPVEDFFCSLGEGRVH